MIKSFLGPPGHFCLTQNNVTQTEDLNKGLSHQLLYKVILNNYMILYLSIKKGDESDDLLANEDEDDPLEISGKSSAGTGIPTLPLALAENSSLTDPNGEDDDDDSDGWSNGQPYGRVSHGDNR